MSNILNINYFSWRCGSSSHMREWQEQGPEFKPQYHQKQTITATKICCSECLKPIIPATAEAGIRRNKIKGPPGKVCETPLQPIKAGHSSAHLLFQL
jgi:hypothetical protein